MVEDMVVVDNLNKRYGDENILSNVSFKVPQGEFFVIIGPSPSGKSVLLKCIMGLEKPTEGRIYIDEHEVTDTPASKRNITLVFQNFMLFPHMRVFDNIAFGLRMRHHSAADIKSEVEEVMELVGLEGLGGRFPRELSGGQQQRVALARSIVVKPRVILFDEPIINLDFKLQRRLCVELKLLHRRLGLTFIYVTHSMEQAMNLADRILVLNKGLIEQVGTPQYLYTSPNSVFVANFVGELNVLSGELASISGNTATVKTPAGVFTGTMRGGDAHQGKVAYAVRPELIELEDEAKVCPNRVEANLTEQIYKGSDVQYLTQLPDGSTLRVLKKGGRILDLKKRLGQKVLLGWENGSAVLLTKMSSSRDIEPGRA